MKVLYLFFVLCILGICAQRRLAKPDETNLETSSQRPASRGRGRTRFSITPEFEEASADYEAVTKNTRKTDVPRRKVENAKPAEKRLSRPAKEPSPKSRPYEVKEVLDDIPREDSRRINKKPRVVTESRFEAANAPKKDLFTPASLASEELPPNLSSVATPAVPESIAEETALPAQLTTIPINAISSTEKSAEESSKTAETLEDSSSSDIPKVDTELKRKQAEPTVSSTNPPESRRASQGRASSRTRGTTGHRVEEQTTPGSRTRTRTKLPRKSEEPAPVAPAIPSTRSNFRPGRRRAEAVAESVQEPVKARGPSVFAAESSQELPSRSRTGRKVSTASERRSEQRNRSEEARTSGRSRSGRTKATTTTTPSSSTASSSTTSTTSSTASSISNEPEKVDLNLSRRVDTRRRGRITERSTEGSVTSTSSNKVKNVNEQETRSQRRGGSRGATTQRNVESTTQQVARQPRGRGRSRSFLTLNEQKLEVLPLFETEPKTVPQSYDSATVPSRSSLSRRRSLNSAEDIATASTKQSEVQVEVDPINEEPQSDTQSNIRISRQQSISVDSNTEKAIRKVYKKRPTYQRSKQPRKLHQALADSREEVTEAVFIRKFRPLNSRRNIVVEDSSTEEAAVNDEKEKVANEDKENTANEKKEEIANEEKEETANEEKEKPKENNNVKQSVKVDKPKVSFRQVVRKVSQKLPSTKGKEKVSVELTTSQEDITEGDNYPAPYKAAIQAKKGKKEGLGSRSTQSNELSVTKTTEKTVTSSASTTLESSAPSEAPDAENAVNEDEEIDHKSETESTTIAPSTKFPRPRFSLTTKQPRSTENSSESTSKNESNRPVLPSRKYKPSKPKPAATTTTQDSTTQGSTEENEASSTSTPSPLQKFHARFKSTRNQKDKRPEIHITPRTAHKSRSYSPKAPKGLYSSRKLAKTTIPPDVSEETEKPKPPKFSVETSALSTKVPPVGHPIKKSSRFSARYRSDILSRSAAHRTTTAGPSYVPTVPTVTPPPTSVKVEENELGMEIISLDDPVANTVPSANLISGDYLSSSPSTNTDPSVESKGAAAHTTEKPVSIIERIINSITSISTTTSPDSTTKTSTTTSGQPTKSSAIQNLVSKRPKDKTVTIDLPLESGSQKLTNSPNSVDYRTTEKPTTIIEKILSSLSAIRADAAPETTTVDPLQVGSNYNTVDTTINLSTESTSRIAKTTVPMSKGSSVSALPLISENISVLPTSTASSSSTSGSSQFDSDTSSTFNDISTVPLGTSSITPRSIPSTTPLSSQITSTTLDPTNAFEEITADQTLPRRTIDKLLSLLNIITPTTTTSQPTTTKLVIVTPKLTTFVTSNTEPINTEQNATPAPTTLPTTFDSTSAIVSSTSETTTPTLFTSTLRTPSEISSDDINSIVNPLSSAEPTVSSRILDMISTISRLMASTLSPTTTISPTTSLTSEGGSSTNLPNTTPVVSTTPLSSTGISVTTGGSGSITTSEASGTSVASTVPSTTGSTVSITASTTSGASTATTTPTTTAAFVTVTTPATTGTSEVITTSAAAANPLAITTPIAAVTDSSTVSTATSTNSPLSTTGTSQTSPVTSTTTTSTATNPSTITSTTAGVSSTVTFPTTTQRTTSTEVSVAQGSESSAPSTTPNSITSTVSSNTQSTSTLLTTVNTIPTLTSTTSSPVTTSTTRPQTEATSAGTGTTGSSIITSTTKFTRETTTDSTLDVPTTLPTLANFEVSPDRVSVYSANDISSTFVPDDSVSTTVSISARAFVPGTTLSTIAEVTTVNPASTTQNAMPTSPPTVGTTGISSTVVSTTLQNNVGSTSTATPYTASPTTNSISSSTTTANNIISGSTAAPTTSAPVITTTNSLNSASNAADATTQDVSSNTIDTNSVTDKQSVANQTDVSNLVNPLSAGTNVSVADNSSMSSVLFVSPSLSDNSTFTTNTRISMEEFMSRGGKLLRFESNPLQNDIQNKPVLRDKDYFIFAVLPNNTILRKRPSTYPTKETPFLIYGVLPNNTLIQKFPNGTIVPMEPVIQVIGFDTRENPPPPPEIISNQVTPDQESRPDNNRVSTGGVARITVPSLEANELSLNSDNNTTASTLPSLTGILGGRTITAFNSIVNQTNGETPKVQTLDVDPLTNRVRLDKVAYSGNVIFRWKPVTRPNFTPVVPQVQSRVNVENVEINTISSASSSPPPPPTPVPSSSTTKVPPTTQPPGPPNTEAPPTTPLPLTTPAPVVTTRVAITSPKITTRSPITTILPSTNPPGPPSTNPTTQTPLPKVTSTTARVPSTTFFPIFLTTLLSTLQPQRRVTTVLPLAASTTVPPAPTTTAAVTTTSASDPTTLTIPFTSPLPKAPVAAPNPLSIISDDLSNAISTTAVPPITLMDLLSNGGVSTTVGSKVSTTPLPTTVLSTTVAALKNINSKQKQLTEQQKKDLEVLEALEKEQAAILQQLAFLTGLNLGAPSPSKGKDNLAERVIATAMERIKGVDSSSTNSPPTFNLLETLSPKDTRQSKTIAAPPSVEELVKQINANGLNSVTPSGPIVTSTYGKTSDALLASLLKEYGVGPSTPKVLSGAFNKEIGSTTKAPKVTTTKRTVTTQAPRPLMQGLNWLLNAFAPKPPAKAPQAKPKPKPKPANNEELLSRQPTEITPVVVESPIPDQPGEESKTENNVITQTQLVALVKQLEEIQKDPKKAKDLDIEALKALQSIESNLKSAKSTSKSVPGIQVIAASSTGAASRTKIPPAKPASRSTTPIPLPLSVSNSIVEDIGLTSGTKSTLPPVDLKDVPGVAQDLEAATTKTKIPPVKLNPVPGVPDENPRIRGQLVNYAINVTKAISSFLGSALQGASSRFVNVLSTGSGNLSHLFNSSSNSGNILSASSSSA